MLGNAFVFGLVVSTVITIVIYMINKSKNKSEQEQSDKLNDMVILFITCFVLIVMTRIFFDSLLPTTMSTSPVVETKGGQCPF